MTEEEQSRRISALKQEIMLQVNQRLYTKGLITEEMYEHAKIKIVNGT